MSEPTALVWASAPEPITLPDALAAVVSCLGDGAVAFLSSPDEHTVAVVAGTGLAGPDGPVEVADVYSARVFSPAAELRWVHSGGGLGEAVLVSESKCRVDGWADELSEVAERAPNTYALWGRRVRPHPSAPGWVRAEEGRIGWIDVPLAGAVRATPDGQDWPSQYVALATVEYLGLDGHDNVRLLDERLVELTLATPKSGKDA